MNREQFGEISIHENMLITPKRLWITASVLLELSFFSAGFFVLLPFLTLSTRLNWLTFDLTWPVTLILGLTTYVLVTTYTTGRIPTRRHKQQSLLTGASITLIGTLALWLSETPVLSGPQTLWFVIGGALLMAGARLVSAVIKSYLHHFTTQQSVGLFLGVHCGASIAAAIIALLYISTQAWSPETNQNLFNTLCHIVPLSTGAITVLIALATCHLSRKNETPTGDEGKTPALWKNLSHAGRELRKTRSLRYLLLSRLFCSFAFSLTGFLVLNIIIAVLGWTYFQIACLALGVGASWAVGAACAGYADSRTGARAALGFGTLLGILLLLGLNSVLPGETQLAAATNVQEATVWVTALTLLGSACLGFLNVANDTLIARFSSSKDFLLWFGGSMIVTTSAFILAALALVTLVLTDNVGTTTYLAIATGCLSLLLLKPVKSDISLIIHADTSLTRAYPLNMSGSYAF